jgi:hypothetical protein
MKDELSINQILQINATIIAGILIFLTLSSMDLSRCQTVKAGGTSNIMCPGLPPTPAEEKPIPLREIITALLMTPFVGSIVFTSLERRRAGIMSMAFGFALLLVLIWLLVWWYFQYPPLPMQRE